MKYLLLFALLGLMPDTTPAPSVQEIATKVCSCGQPLAKVANETKKEVLEAAFKETMDCVGGFEAVQSWYKDLSVEDELAKEKAVVSQMQTQCPEVAKGLLKIK